MAEEAAASNTAATTEPKADSSSSGGWWGFFDNVKKKSEVILNAYKEDLTEFATSIKSDAQKVVDSGLTSTISNKLNQFTETISTLITDDKKLGTSPEKSNETYMSKLEALQTNTDTFTMKPEDVAFFQWTETFDVEAKSDEISKILANNQQVSEMYHQMVPSVLTMKEFWGRYYYKLEKINQEETRRAALVKKAEELQQKKENELDVGWGDDDEPSNNEASANTNETNESTLPNKEGEEIAAKTETTAERNQSEPTEQSGDREEKIINEDEGQKQGDGEDDIFSWS